MAHTQGDGAAGAAAAASHHARLRRPNLPTDLLRPSLLELYFVDCPHSPFYVFYSHKTLVKTKIMPDCVLQLV